MNVDLCARGFRKDVTLRGEGTFEETPGKECAEWICHTAVAAWLKVCCLCVCMCLISLKAEVSLLAAQFTERGCDTDTPN